MSNTGRKTPLIRYLINGIGYSAYFSFVFGFTLFAVPLSLIFIPFGLQEKLLHGAMQKALYHFTYHFLTILPVVSIDKVVGVENIPKGGAVFVANHQSWLDGLLLLGLLPNSTPVMKGSYARNILYRQFVRWTKFITIDPGSTDSTKEALEQAMSILERGKRVLVFPEGTRSSNGRIHSFRPFAFKIAKESRVPIIPITITYTPRFMTKEFSSFFPSKRVEITITIHSAIASISESTDTLSSQTRQIIQKSLKEKNG